MASLGGGQGTGGGQGAQGKAYPLLNDLLEPPVTIPMIDAAVARHLLRAVQSAELLGSRGLLVGVGPEMAETLVSLNVDFGRITARGTLQSGLAYAMKRVARRRSGE